MDSWSLVPCPSGLQYAKEKFLQFFLRHFFYRFASVAPLLLPFTYLKTAVSQFDTVLVVGI